MSETPGHAPPPHERDSAIAVISAYGAFRVLLVLLAIWSFFAGFALVTGGLDPAISLGEGGRTAERVAGLQMIAVTPVYGLIVWRREQYRLLVWIPYAMQLAVIIPAVLALRDDASRVLLLLIVSSIFLVLLFYFWWHSHPLSWFQPGEEGGDDDYDADADVIDDEEAEDEEQGSEEERAAADAEEWARGRPRPQQPRRPGRFRRRG